jgi:transcriptional regulator with XRE-family HTH domain
MPMKNQLSIQEKLEDLRRERDLTQDTVASAIGITGPTLSKYENKENKEYNIATLNKLAGYYGVSLEWLVGNTEIRESTNSPIDELLLDDETIELLKSGRFNNRLLCEIIKHPDFIKLMTDTEIYVDGIATMQIKNMNDWLDAVRLQIIQQKNPDANDLYLKVLESSHIQEEEYFFHTIHSDWDNIIRTIRENHEHAAESAPIERPMSNDKKVQRFLHTLKFKSNPIEEFWRFFCDEMQIPFEQLSVDEHKTMKDVFKRSKLLRTLPNRKKGKK